jgi:hypothetical protein
MQGGIHILQRDDQLHDPEYRAITTGGLEYRRTQRRVPAAAQVIRRRFIHKLVF